LTPAGSPRVLRARIGCRIVAEASPSVPENRGIDVEKLVPAPTQGHEGDIDDVRKEPTVIVLPILLGDGMRLTPALNTDTRLTLERERPLPGGSVEIIYACA
jgi:hypothetical protein